MGLFHFRPRTSQKNLVTTYVSVELKFEYVFSQNFYFTFRFNFIADAVAETGASLVYIEIKNNQVRDYFTGKCI